MAPKTAVIEEMITQRVVAAGIRLRFDKVALRLLGGVKASVAQALPAGESIAFTVTAPIKLPAKTSVALQQRLHRLPTHGLSTTINGNKIRARKINHTSKDMPRVIGFVSSSHYQFDHWLAKLSMAPEGLLQIELRVKSRFQQLRFAAGPKFPKTPFPGNLN